MDSFPTPITEADALRNLISRLAPVSPSQGLIRLGPAGDGGYLVPDDLEGIEACFSPGVGRTFGFEHDCVELGMQAFLADKSVNRPPAADEAFRFVQKYIGATTSTANLVVDDVRLGSAAMPEAMSSTGAVVQSRAVTESLAVAEPVRVAPAGRVVTVARLSTSSSTSRTFVCPI